MSRKQGSAAASQVELGPCAAQRGASPFVRGGLAVLAGGALAAAFPPSPLHWLAWFALLPLLIAIEGRSPASTFRLGLLAGFVHFLALLYWIVFVLGHYGGLHPFLAVPPLLLLCLYLALYPALFCLGFTQLARLPGAPFWGAALWTALEFLRARLLSGFPWCPLATSQFENLTLIQIVDITGAGGLSFLIVFVNLSLYQLMAQKKKNSRRSGMAWALFCAVMLASVLGYGVLRLKDISGVSASGEKLKVALVQADIDQSLKWDKTYQHRTLDLYERLTKAAHPFTPDLIVWPETAVPFFFGADRNGLSERVVESARSSHAALLFGSPACDRSDGETRYYNRAYLLSPDGEVAGYYDKVHLVPFGEYIPLKDLLFFVDRLVPAAGDFTRGEGALPIVHGDLSLGVLICFEAVFPELARKDVLAGANLLINLTNDAWFGRSSAPYQHLAMSVFRAVENRVPLARAANTGISAFVDPTGKLLETSPLFSEALLLETLSLPKTHRETVYTRWGDGWVVVFGLAVLIRLVFAYWKKHRRRNHQAG